MGAPCLLTHMQCRPIFHIYRTTYNGTERSKCSCHNSNFLVYNTVFCFYMYIIYRVKHEVLTIFICYHIILQIGGIRFLFDNLVESLQRYNISQGFGCILAHAMGLGKTLQLIAFIDVFLRHTSGKHVLCVVPINTIQNWFAEFNLWLPEKPEAVPSNENGANEDNSEDVTYREFPVYLLNDNQKTMLARAKIIGLLLNVFSS